jgi:hypothetical protein
LSFSIASFLVNLGSLTFICILDGSYSLFLSFLRFALSGTENGEK